MGHNQSEEQMAPSARKLAFIGLGVMGGPMAGHLAAAGHDVTVFNRTTAKADAWVAAHGGAKAMSPAAAADGADVVFACVGNDDDVRQVTLGDDGALIAMGEGTVFVDHTTASATLAREIDVAAKGRGIGFLDAPVSGGQAGAEQGQLTIMVGGDGEVFATAEPVMAIYSKAVTLMGPAGAGQLTKMVNQICIAGLVQGLSEALNFGLRAGLDMDKAIDVIAQGAAQSWQLENRGKTMIRGEFDFGFAVDWMRKDLGICRDEAAGNGAELPVAEIVDGFYARIQERGGGRWDTSSLISLLAKP
jgi:3-hydroxyisobutyrate dehydrogenase-like beta-hydroxyacid dehydrogenase